MNLPGLENIYVIESKPMLIYEGCQRPGQVPFIIRLIDWFKNVGKNGKG
jgi:hypothetical protein